MILARIGAMLFWALAVFYAYSAAAHVATMMGWTGFDWASAPTAWRVQGYLYLILNLAIVLSIVRAPLVGAVLLGITAFSQILLYTFGRDWVLSVSPQFSMPNAARGDIDAHVASHFIALCLATVALWITRDRED
jgi:hypothetical protein